ncbi:MAG: MBL fold metallo-hydrolase [Desulfomonile tiedjei]|uniref:MBL fold metallo-hydrolase n=1 Tax=Desulfomonile tiedjei TaxID=2358 RepID=A0A9D6Z002_9BACT|nr:MBL fold metallo-hydrolase [Desulfomonile tiedjei]
MEIVFLGTGSAWCTPEYSCDCAICAKMNQMGEERTRTSILIKGEESILVDCGPDLRIQMKANRFKRPDAVLITHEHGDHYLGMDDLLVFRRSTPVDKWNPIPVYATEEAWKAIEIRFGYLLGTLIEKRIASPGARLEGLHAKITPFKTFHGPSAPGSVGYVYEADASGADFKLVYTSDFMRIEDEPSILMEPDILIIQANWLNEPEFNRPHHMSFQSAMQYIRTWKPRKATYLVHISDMDHVPGDPGNNFMKKIPPESPLHEPGSGEPYPIPRCHDEWQKVVDRISAQYELPYPIFPARDGLKVVC